VFPDVFIKGELLVVYISARVIKRMNPARKLLKKILPWVGPDLQDPGRINAIYRQVPYKTKVKI
jgi:hypothetical protein